jgi:hypothetical protein
MELTDYMLWKAIALVVIAFFAGLFGLIPPEGEGRSDRPRE